MLDEFLGGGGKSIRPRWREMVGRYQAGARNGISKAYGSYGSKSRCKSMSFTYGCYWVRGPLHGSHGRTLILLRHAAFDASPN